MKSSKVAKAIERIKAFAPPDGEPYYLCYSGGKDSDCIRILTELSGVPYEIHHNLTTVDAPETIRYIQSIPGVIIDKAYYSDRFDKNGKPLHKTMWNLIVRKKFPPTRMYRYCCEHLKERGGGKGRFKITGVRSAESPSRAKNGGFVKIIGKPVTVQKKAEELGAEYYVTEKQGLVLNFDNSESVSLTRHCYRTTSTLLNPILDWSDDDVWEFLHYYRCEGNPLYQCGEKRIGCIGCPLQGYAGMKKDFEKYPKYRAAYVRALDRMLKARAEAGIDTRITTWLDGEHVLRWWQGDDPMQLSFF